MSGYDEPFTGEYVCPLKHFKIPFKKPDKQINIENPPVPGTEKILLNSNIETNTIYDLQVQHIDKINQDTTNDTANQNKKRRFMMPSAGGLPDELIKLFKPLCCDLCSTKLNSPSSARLHYESKNHEKKTNAWLADWSSRTGEPIPKRQNLQKGPTGPNVLHCDVCDIALTSNQHAKQHYMGRRHRNVLAGTNKPKGIGYYDANIKWIRTAKIEEDPTNRFGIGESFLMKQDNETVVVPVSVLNEPPPPPPSSPPPPPPPPSVLLESPITSPESKNAIAFSEEIAQLNATKVINIDPSKYCQICDISVTSEMHMRLHLTGAKHSKKLRQLGEPPYTEALDTISQCIIEDTIKPTPKKILNCDNGISKVDYSVFRTPSGQYYCNICNLSVTSEVMLAQHMISKKHLKTSAASKKR